MDFKLLSIVLGIIVVFLIIMFAFVNFRFSKMLKARKKREAEGVMEKDGVRYTLSQEIYNEEGDINVSLSQKDFILKKDTTFKVGKKADLKPGKYTLLTTSGDEGAFNVRIGGLVREYHHADSIVLGDGDEITCVSHTIILR